MVTRRFTQSSIINIHTITLPSVEDPYTDYQVTMYYRNHPFITNHQLKSALNTSIRYFLWSQEPYQRQACVMKSIGLVEIIMCMEYKMHLEKKNVV